MIELAQKRVKLGNGIALDVVDEGPRDQEALIFLHGFPENHRTWRHQIAHFARYFRCIAPDQRGYRGSSKPQDVPAYTPDKLIGDVFALADALEIERFTIIGHDWGGAIAWGVAHTGQNARVDRAVIANAPHPLLFQKLLYLDPGQRASSQYIRAFRDRENDALIRAQGLTGLMLKAVKWDKPSAMPDSERAILLKDWEDREAAFGMLNYYRASPLTVPQMDAPFEVPEDYSPPALERLTIPTLVIWAMEDLALPPANLAGLGEYIEDITLVEVPDCGHFVPWEAPDAVIRAMDGFLTLETGAPG